MSKFSQSERLKMLVAAFDFCPACQKAFLTYASENGVDPIKYMRELLWRIWGQWDHGDGCPQELEQVVPAEAAPRAAQVSTELLRHGPGTDNSVALGAAPGAGIPSNQGSREPSMVLRDPEAGSLA